MPIVIGNPNKSKTLNEEVKKSNLSVEAKSYINDLIANDLNEYLNMAVPESKHYDYGEAICSDVKIKVIPEC